MSFAYTHSFFFSLSFFILSFFLPRDAVQALFLFRYYKRLCHYNQNFSLPRRSFLLFRENTLNTNNHRENCDTKPHWEGVSIGRPPRNEKEKFALTFSRKLFFPYLKSLGRRLYSSSDDFLDKKNSIAEAGIRWPHKDRQGLTMLCSMI